MHFYFLCAVFIYTLSGTVTTCINDIACLLCKIKCVDCLVIKSTYLRIVMVFCMHMFVGQQASFVRIILINMMGEKLNVESNVWN